MKLDYLIDTNIFISLFNDQLSEPIPDSQLGYSIITKIELLSFTSLSEEEEKLIRTSLKSLSEISLNSNIADIAEKTIQLRQKYNLKIPDAIIVSSAWETQSILITNDQQLKKINEIEIISLGTKTP
ncbi:type II toxin-antitoxin system VapC family toxin [Crocosphaera chwakensis]|nr:type II toxin-antitoxin system VapC family toxin [Crocosphaera chwakensis]